MPASPACTMPSCVPRKRSPTTSPPASPPISSPALEPEHTRRYPGHLGRHPSCARGSFMRFLVTGTAGFIGFHLAQRLLADGHAVTGIDGITPYYDQSAQARAACATCQLCAIHRARTDAGDRPARSPRSCRGGARDRRPSRGAGRRALQPREPARLYRFQHRRHLQPPGSVARAPCRHLLARLHQLGLWRQQAAAVRGEPSHRPAGLALCRHQEGDRGDAPTATPTCTASRPR